MNEDPAQFDGTGLSARNEGAQRVETLRAFVALTLPDQAKDDAARLAAGLRTGMGFTPCRPLWTEPATYHLTLAFLGKIEKSRLGEVREAMELAFAGGAIAPNLKLKGLGVFPDWRSPSVLWVGIADKGKHLRGLQYRLSGSLGGLVHDPGGNRFHPHLTLARFKSLKGVSAARGIMEAHLSYESESFAPVGMTLFESVLSDEGARHIPLFAIPFEAGNE